MNEYYKEMLLLFTYFLKSELKLSKNTIIAYKSDLISFFDFLENENIYVTKMERINKTNLMAYFLYLEKNEKSLSTIARNTSTLKTFFKYLLDNKYISSDPVAKIKSQKVEIKQPDYATVEQMEHFLNQPNFETKKGIRDKAMLELMYATGLLAHEIVSLEIQHINMDFEYVQCMSSDKFRVIPLNESTLKSIKIYINEIRPTLLSNENDKILFMNMNGTSLSRQGLWKIIKAYSTLANMEIDITPNVLRQSFAMHLANNGADIDSLNEMMGHVNLSTTQSYFIDKRNKLKEVYEKTHPRK